MTSAQQTQPGDDAALVAYLNQPVRDIMGQLGLSTPSGPGQPPGAPPNSPPANAATAGGTPSGGSNSSGSPSASPDSGSSNGQGSPIDPSALISPVTQALGSLGSGQFGSTDPTQMLGSLAQSLDSAGSSVQQALSNVPGDWLGEAATAAQGKTASALASGTQVSRQSTDLSRSLMTAVTSVARAEARLMEIITQFWATIAAIGPSIIFPWGIAEAIQAAMQAVSSAAEVMTETTSTLASEASATQAIGSPVEVTSAPQAGGGMSGLGELASQVASSLSGALGSGSGGDSPADASDSAGAPTGARGGPPLGSAGSGAGGSSAPTGGGSGGSGIAGGAKSLAASAPAGPSAARPAAPIPSPGSSAANATPSPTSGGGSMGAGAPMGGHARAGGDNSHSAAEFLHTSDQGDEVVGGPGSVAPAVIGETGGTASPDVDLRI